MGKRHLGALTDAEKRQIGSRLRLVRDALGLGLAEFYEPVGISSSQASAIENSAKGLGVGKALDLQAKWNISLDWIYAGNMRTLTVELGDAIRGLQAVRVAQGERPEGRQKRSDKRPSLRPQR